MALKSTLAVVAFLGGVALAQQDPAPVPFPNHEEPPANWYCTPDAKQADHRCTCKNMAKDSRDPVCERETEDDAQCLVWCHKDHCACQIKCEES